MNGVERPVLARKLFDCTLRVITFFFSSRRRHTRYCRDWSSDVCSSDLASIMNRKPSGTPDYAAPEVFRSRLSNRTDQYALAITYCQLRGGRLPFPDTPSTLLRSEERRVAKECRIRWVRY